MPRKPAGRAIAALDRAAATAGAAPAARSASTGAGSTSSGPARGLPGARKSCCRAGSRQWRRTRLGAFDHKRRFVSRAFRAATRVAAFARLERATAGHEPDAVRRLDAEVQAFGAAAARRCACARRAGLSKSAASRQFVALSVERMKEWMASDLSGIDILVIQIGSLYIAEHLRRRMKEQAIRSSSRQSGKRRDPHRGIQIESASHAESGHLLKSIPCVANIAKARRSSPNATHAVCATPPVAVSMPHVSPKWPW
jgi:hypothetical protein